MVAERVEFEATASEQLPETSEVRGVLLWFPEQQKNRNASHSPPVLQFHDGTPEGEDRFFRAMGPAYFYDGDKGCEDEKKFSKRDIPLINPDLETIVFLRAYWSDLAQYYEAKREALGFSPWNGELDPEIEHEYIDLYDFTPQQPLSPIGEVYLKAFAADE